LRPKLINSGRPHINLPNSSLDQLSNQGHARQPNGNVRLFSPNYLLDS
jgi:hypothetical protein